MFFSKEQKGLKLCLNSSLTIYAGFCPHGWLASEYTGTCVKLVQERVTWFQAREVCMHSDGDLVKILHPAMNEFLYSRANFYPVIPAMPYLYLLYKNANKGAQLWLWNRIIAIQLGAFLLLLFLFSFHWSQIDGLKQFMNQDRSSSLYMHYFLLSL